MGALTNVLKSAMTRKYVPEESSTALATRSMGTSVKAMEILRRPDEGSKTMRIATSVIGAKHSKQETVVALGKQLGQLEAWAKQQAMLNKQIKLGAAHYIQGTKSMTDSALTIAETSQKVGVLNSEAQKKAYNGHTESQLNIAINQSAYAGAGWSA